MPLSNEEKLARVVIGANFGDEGKGLLTDYYTSLAAKENYPVRAYVIRFNGGAQAGHTVVMPGRGGRRHIFSHIGSGAFTGATTFLSRYFVVNPRFYMNEFKALNLGSVAVDPNAVVSVPYDRLINELVEQARGVNRHGSVGVGINETVRRSEHRAYRLTVSDLYDLQLVARQLNRIVVEWIPRRLTELGFPDILSDADKEMLTCPSFRSRFYDDCSYFTHNSYTAFPVDLIANRFSKIFEGAQGLLLDPDYGVMPYVTPSHTGLKNVVPLAREMYIQGLDVTYVTRCYVTRHGAGPLPFECEKPYPGIVDETNLPHKFQGELRFAPLNIDVLKESITKDLKWAAPTENTPEMPVNLTIAVTCLDQVGDAPLRYVLDGTEAAAPIEQVLGIIREQLKPAQILTAYGPTRTHVKAFA